MRMIDADDLKSKCNELIKFNPTTDRILDLIDNAPTVDITRICMEHYKQGRKDEKAEANGELMQSFSP